MRTAGLGYLWTSLILFAGVLMVLGIWYFALGLGECESHHPSQSESLLLAGDSHLQYAWHRAWRLFSRLHPGLVYEGGAVVFGGMLALIAALYFFTNIS